MNEKILDSPFENEFHFKLKSDEEILWENEYFSGWSFSKLMRKNLSIIPIIIGCCIILTSILGLFFKRIDVNLLFGFIIITCIFLNYISQKRNPSIRYILTSQRLIFHTTKKQKRDCFKHSSPQY